MRLIAGLAAALAAALVLTQPTHAQTTAAEVEAVRRVVEETTKAFNAERLDDVLALYADDAKIDSKAAGAQISKSQYRETMTRVLAQRSVSRSDVGSLKVSLIDDKHAVVDGVVYIQLASGGRSGGKNQWKLEKRDGRWLIVETKYQ